jgi:hypothetical protein
MRVAELDYVNELVAEIAAGTLGGIEWWRAIHAGDSDGPPLAEPYDRKERQ